MGDVGEVVGSITSTVDTMALYTFSASRVSLLS